MVRNIGIVKWFGTKGENYGFIKFLCGNDNPQGQLEFFFHRGALVSSSFEPGEGDLVSFDVVLGRKDLNAAQVKVLDAKTLADEISFTDEADYKNFREKVLSAKGAAFFDKFIAAVSEETLKKFANAFTAEDLCKKIILLESEHSAAELAKTLEENTDAEKFPRLSNAPTKNFLGRNVSLITPRSSAKSTSTMTL